jgi:uncharacterized paraquat-inducible protein A
MTRSPERDVPNNQPIKDAPKLRQCLRCQAAFNSEWAGERICSRCKSTTTWRHVNPFLTNINRS